MSSSSANLYFLAITVVPQKEGQDVPALIRRISDLLLDKPHAIKIIYKLKVTGEAKVIAVVEVWDGSELERIVAGLWKLGPVDVECQPTINYEQYAEESMKVSGELCKLSSNWVEKEGLYWFDFSLEYHGLKFDELMSLWKKEAETVLAQRSRGELKLELFKCLSQRRVHALINGPDAAKLDNMTLNLPIMKENGHNISIIAKKLQFLDDYVARMTDPKP